MKKFESERAEKATDEEFKIGCKVRVLRDEGTAWWQIARDLEMEGAGDSATTGKKGAARARQAYAKAFGSHPRTFTKGSKAFSAEKNEHVAAANTVTKAERVAKVKKGKSGIKGIKKMTDEQLEAMLVGRKITWIIQTQDGELHEAARVHRNGFKVVDYPSGRGIEFREAEEKSKIGGVRGIPSRYRCVLLTNIHTVK
jgi:hypothetical protein